MKFIIPRWSFVLSFSAPFVMIIYELNAENLSNKTGQRTTLYVGSMAPMTGKRAWWVEPLAVGGVGGPFLWVVYMVAIGWGPTLDLLHIVS